MAEARRAWGTVPSFTAMAAAAAAGLLVFWLWIGQGWGGEALTTAFADIASAVFPLLAGAACILTARRASGARRTGWYALASACLAWGGGQMVWTYYELVAGVEVPFPSYADLGYLLFIPLAAGALLSLGELGRYASLGVRSLLDGLITASGMFLVSWALVLGPLYSASGDASALERTIGLLYPVGDVMLLTMAVLATERVPREGRRPIYLVIAGVACIAISDSAFSYLTLHGLYTTGSPVDLGWVAGFALIGLAAGHPAAARFGADPGAWKPNLRSALLPYVVVVVGTIVALRSALVRGRLDAVLLVAGTCVLLLVAARQLLTLLENLRLNRVLEEANQRLRADEGLRVELINAIAHDLANPLSPIIIQAAVLREGGDLSPTQKRSIQIVEKNARQMKILLADLADVAKIQAGKIRTNPMAADLRQLAGQAVESFEEEARRRRVRLALMDGPPAPVAADPTRIVQVLYNYISNALKFTPEGGEIQVVVGADAAHCSVRVRDTGRGLDATEITRLFKPFSQVHAPGEIPERGTGLGLYISRGIVEAHGGTVAVASDGRGRGTTFSFSLPNEAPAANANEPRALPAGAAGILGASVERN